MPAKAEGKGDEAADGDDEGKPFYVPGNAKLQFAGNVGLLAAGIGWSWWHRTTDLDLLFGWVPPLDGTEAIYIGTLKVTVWPVDLDLGKRWRLRPLSVGGTISLTFGDHYFILPPDRYPKSYYDFSTAVRFGGFLGGSFGRLLPGTLVRGVDFYWEVGVTDLELWLVLESPHALAISDIVHVALGLAVAF